MRDTAGNIITEGSFYVGAEVTFHGHCFRVTAADDKTLRLMEERAASGFVYSDPTHAAEVLAGAIGARTRELRASLRRGGYKVGGGMGLKYS